MKADPQDLVQLHLALRLAAKGRGLTSPNPAVGAVLTRAGREIGRGWHHRAGGPHAEIEVLRDAAMRGLKTSGSTLFVTLEPCSTHGRTPPCTNAIIAAGIKRVVVAATDPNPAHSGRGLEILGKAGIEVESGLLADRAEALNEPFNHWIVNRQPLVTLKAAMTLDGKIATASGESKWITGPEARKEGMKLRQFQDAILAGVETVLRDDPSLTWRPVKADQFAREKRPLRRIILDSSARTPLSAKVVTDEFSPHTTIFVTEKAPRQRVKLLGERVRVVVAPLCKGKVDLRWALELLGQEDVTSLLVEGGGEVHGAFVEHGLARRIVFFYAPLILGGGARPVVAGDGISPGDLAPRLTRLRWKRLGADLMLTASIQPPAAPGLALT